MKKSIFLTGMICSLLLLNACASSPTIEVITAAVSSPQITAEPSAQPTPSLETTPLPEKTSVKGTVTVRGGDTLERDIIPQLCDVFSLSGEQVKDALSLAQSCLIGNELTDFRRMEGIIVPGTYVVTDETPGEMIDVFVSSAEQRYDRLLAACSDANDLEAWERLALASIVDWECLSDEFQAEAAAVLLNRLEDGGKLQCCATVEYALGYSRPYLTSEDIEVASVYNTYEHRGLPPGPICTVDDISLSASMGKSTDGSLYFFFYDYAPATMQFFSDYNAFKEKANISRQMFLEAFDIGKHDMIDKRSVFG